MIDATLIETSCFSLDVASRRLTVNSVVINLRNKEFHLLIYFMRNVGIILSRAKILEDVWDANIFCNTNTVDVHVSNLRQKFKAHMKEDPIKTVYCIGYRFEL